MTRFVLFFVLALLALDMQQTTAMGQTNVREKPTLDSVLSASRIALFGGLGVSYMNPQDIVDLINTASIGSQRVSEFKSAVEFFGGLVIPVNGDVTVKAEYAYLLTSYNVSVPLGVQEYTITGHLPTVLVQYILVSEPTYNVKAGGGLGYHFGFLETKLGGLEDRFSGSGLGIKLDLEASTALGENLFAYLGADMRWDFIGDLTNGSGGNPSGIPGTPTSLHFLSVGAKLGFSHYF